MTTEKTLPVWIIQHNAIGDTDLSRLLKAIKNNGMEAKTVTVIPFSHELSGDLPIVDRPCICYGSSGLLRLANKLSWKPAGWDGSGFSQEATVESLGNLCLNADTKFGLWSEILSIAEKQKWQKIFVRPSEETKEFAGQTYSISEFREWWHKLKNINYFEDHDALACIAPAKKIGQEWRLFVIDNKIVTGSLYATESKPNRSELVPDKVIDFAKSIIDVYQPAPCFVLDIAETLDNNKSTMKVVEFNSINSAGFYEADTNSIVISLSNYISEHF